jgi:hypothetical protein
MTTQLVARIELENLRWTAVPVALQPRFNALPHEEESIGATTRPDQIEYTCHLMREDPSEARGSLSVITEFFGVPKGSVDWDSHRYRATVMANDRPRTLPHEAYPYVAEVVRERFAERKPVSYRLLHNAIEWRFGISSRLDTRPYLPDSPWGEERRGTSNGQGSCPAQSGGNRGILRRT